MALNLPELVQEMRLDISKWLEPLKSAADYLKGFNNTVADPRAAQGVVSIKSKFDELAASVAKYAAALTNTNKDAEAWGNSYVRQIERIKSSLNDPTLRAGLTNRLMGFNPSGDPKGVSAADVSRLAQQTIDAHKRAQAQVDQYFMEQAAKTRLGFGRIGGGSAGQTASQTFGVVGGQFVPTGPVGTGGVLGGPNPFGYGVKGIGDLFGARPTPGGAVSDMARRMGMNLNGPDIAKLMSYNYSSTGFMGPLQPGDPSKTFMGPPAPTLRYKGPLSGRGFTVGDESRGATADEMRQVFGTGTTVMPSFTRMMGGALTSFSDAVKGLFGSTVEGVKSGWKSAADFIKTTFSSPDAFFGRMLQGGVAIFKGLWSAVTGGLSAVKSAFSGVKNFLADAFSLDSVPKIILTLTGINLLLGTMRAAYDTVTTSLHAMIEGGMGIERMEAVFGVLLGSAERGRQVFGELQGMSIVTPFSVSQLADASEILLGMGVRGQDLIGVLTKLGDVAAGDAGRLRRLAVVYGEVQAEGKLTGWRIRQLASLGVGVEDLAKTMGLPSDLFRGLMRADLVPGDVLTRTIARITQEGERFGGMNKRVLETSSGQWSRLQNVIELTAAKMGKAFIDSSGLAKGIGSTADFVGALQERLVSMASAAGAVAGEIMKVIGPITGAFGGGLLDVLSGGGGGAASQIVGIIKNSALTVQEMVFDTVDVIGSAFAQLFKMLMRGLQAMIEAGAAAYFWITGKTPTKEQQTAFTSLIDVVHGAGTMAPIQWMSLMNNARGRFTAGMGFGGVGGVGGAVGFGAAGGLGVVPGGVPFASLRPEAQALVTDAIKKYGLPAAGIQGVGGSALEKFQNAMKNIDAAVGARGISGGFDFKGRPQLGVLSPELERMTRYDAYTQLRDAVGGKISDQLPPAALYGSAEAYDTIAKTQSDNTDTLGEVLSVLQAGKDIQEQLKDEAVKVNDVLRNLQQQGVI